MSITPRKPPIAATLAIVVLASCSASVLGASELPKHPSDLEYQPLSFEVPRAESLRHELGDGIVAYVVEDHALPLVDVGIRVRIGSFLEPADKVGLAALTGSLMRSGGSASLAPAELDLRVDELAADLFSSIGETSGNASVNCLSSVLDECLELFFEMMKRPRFDAARLELEKSRVLEELKQRNDDPSRIARREWQWLMYGDEHFTSRYVTAETLDAIGAEDLTAFHRDYWRPETMIVTVAGDVDTEAVLAQLEEHFASWPEGGGKEVPWPPPEAHHRPAPGLYVAEKEIPQGRVQIGHLGLKRESWEDPDAFALAVLNDVLGGGGFTSRITKRVRSDEGLAYSAGSTYGVDVFWPGTFFMFFQSKSPTVALAAQIVREELEKIRKEPITDEELRTSKASFVETFPRNFESARATASIFAGDEYVGRPHDYWYQYQDSLRKVTKEDVQRVAERYLKPDELVFLLVGDWETVAPGDSDGRATMSEWYDGRARMLPERDPVTLEPVGQD